ncbi:sterol desaturase family protein [Salisaeta longa]|uniref:sterol desaturase family protein n=1 Tax=Salisaeta longa TaxID=503170 RepID=UPI0003B4583D|nr:sterol desaturase family protein [Salisaeta longa]
MAALLGALQQTQTLAMLAGLVVLLLWEHAHPLFDFFRGDARARGTHALRNLLLGGLNAVIISVGFVGLWGAAALWAQQHDVGLLHALPAAAGWTPWVHALGAVLLLDLWTYLWHRLNHVVPVLWRFHRVHHHDPTMDVTTASRFHTGEIVLSSLFRIGIIVAVGVHLWELVLYETLMFAVVQFHHANIALPPALDRALRAVIVTPNMHKIHHSRWQPETDSNYSALFSWWDRLGRTFRMRADVSAIRFGLDGWDAPAHQSVAGVLRTPWRAPDPAGDASADAAPADAASSVPPSPDAST